MQLAKKVEISKPLERKLSYKQVSYKPVDNTMYNEILLGIMMKLDGMKEGEQNTFITMSNEKFRVTYLGKVDGKFVLLQQKLHTERGERLIAFSDRYVMITPFKSYYEMGVSDAKLDKDQSYDVKEDHIKNMALYLQDSYPDSWEYIIGYTDAVDRLYTSEKEMNKALNHLEYLQEEFRMAYTGEE